MRRHPETQPLIWILWLLWCTEQFQRSCKSKYWIKVIQFWILWLSLLVEKSQTHVKVATVPANSFPHLLFLLGGQLSVPHFEKEGIRKNEYLGDLKSFFDFFSSRYLPGGTYYALFKKDYVKNMSLRDKSQMLILAYFNQITN